MSKNIAYKRRRAATKRHNRALRRLNESYEMVHDFASVWCCPLHAIQKIVIKDSNPNIKEFWEAYNNDACLLTALDK